MRSIVHLRDFECEIDKNFTHYLCTYFVRQNLSILSIEPLRNRIDIKIINRNKSDYYWITNYTDFQPTKQSILTET